MDPYHRTTMKHLENIAQSTTIPYQFVSYLDCYLRFKHVLKVLRNASKQEIKCVVTDRGEVRKDGAENPEGGRCQCFTLSGGL